MKPSPEAVPFELEGGAADSQLERIIRGPAAALTAVALVAGARARASGWAGRAAVAVARQWRGPRHVILADADVANPSLHELTAMAGDVGVADVLEFGLTPRHALRQVDGGAWELLPAGLHSGDPTAALRSPHWSAILLTAVRRRATLLVYLPADAEGVADLIARIGTVIVLAEPDEAETVVSGLAHPYGVLATLTPAASADAAGSGAAGLDGAGFDAAGMDAAGMDAAGPDAVGPDAVGPDAAEGQRDEPLTVAAAADDVIEDVSDAAAAHADPSAEQGLHAPSYRAEHTSDDVFARIRLPTDPWERATLIADLRARQREARSGEQAPAATKPAVPALPDEPVADAGEASAPRIIVPPGGSDVGREMRLESAADDAGLETIEPEPPENAGRRYRRALFGTLIVVFVASVVAGTWHFTRRVPVVPVPAVETPQPETPGARMMDEAVPYDVAIEAHRDLATANRRLDALKERDERFSFHVAPLLRDGTLFYHVLAGPVADSSAAVALRDSLVAARIKTGTTPTDIRHVPLTFLIGDYSSVEAAEAQFEELRRLDVPSYIVVGTAADGAPLYRVHVGAFATEAEADVVRQMLRSAGVRDSLIARTARITPQLMQQTE